MILIEGYYGSSSAPAFHGTGFAAGPDGVFLTNYHVVAERVNLPNKYRLRFRTPGGKTGELHVLAVDVRHDIAAVRAEGHSPPPLPLADTLPENGEHAFSVGYPLDVGMSITEGVSNGLVQDLFGERLHYSGAINPGMSGGPALNTSGQVIGINVSGYFLQQLMSFLVPVENAKALLKRVRSDAAPEPKDLRDELSVQALAHSRALFERLNGPIPVQVQDGFTLPSKLAPFVDCNASGDRFAFQTVDILRTECRAKAGINLQQGLTVGEIHYVNLVLSNSKLGSWRFMKQLSDFASSRGLVAKPHEVGTFSCDSRNVTLKGFDANALVCARGYRRFAGMYDFNVRVVSTSLTDRGFVSHLDLSGVEFDAGTAFIQRFIESMEFTP